MGLGHDSPALAGRRVEQVERALAAEEAKCLLGRCSRQFDLRVGGVPGDVRRDDDTVVGKEWVAEVGKRFAVEHIERRHRHLAALHCRVQGVEIDQAKLDGKDWYSVNLYQDGRMSLDNMLEAAWSHGAPDAFAVRD